MALNKAGLILALEKGFKSMPEDANAAARMMADAIDDYVKTGTVTGQFSGASSAGPVSGTLTGGTII